MKLQSNATFWVASCAFVLVFMTSGTPISLFNLYRVENGLTNADLGVVSLAYFISAAVALLMFGRLSNHIGRKPMALIAIGCCALSCILLMLMTDVTLLFAARLLQGFACGVATSSIGAYAVDAGEHQPKWLVAAVASTSPMVGIPLGAISSGALVTWGPFPKITIFALVLTLLLVCLVLLFNCRETINRQPGTLASLRPSLHLPTGKTFIFVATAGGLLGLGTVSPLRKSTVVSFSATRLPVKAVTVVSTIWCLV